MTSRGATHSSGQSCAFRKTLRRCAIDLHQARVPTYEADVRFAVRFLIDRGIQGGVRISGDPIDGQGVDLCFDNPELAPAAVRIEPPSAGLRH